MKHFIFGIFLFTAVAANAEVVSGKIRNFKGNYVETGMPYSFYALETDRGDKVELPIFVNGALVSRDTVVEMDAALYQSTCTDMSSACMDFGISKLKSIRFVVSPLEIPMQVYAGRVEHLRGRAVESRRTYDYYALSASRVEIPNFLFPTELVKAKAKVELFGVINPAYCTDMSAACGASTFKILGGAKVSL